MSRKAALGLKKEGGSDFIFYKPKLELWISITLESQLVHLNTCPSPKTQNKTRIGPKVEVISNNSPPGTSLMVQWLKLCAPNAGGPGQGTRSHTQQLKDPACRDKDPVCCN